MASRFLFQKFAGGMSRSTSLLGAHVSVSARAAAVHATKYFKQIFSSSASKQAEVAAKKAQDAARKPEISSYETLEREVDVTMGVVAVGSLAWIFIISRCHDDNAGCNKGSKCHCHCHCQCQCHGSNVKQD